MCDERPRIAARRTRGWESGKAKAGLKEEETHSGLGWHIGAESGGGHTEPLRIRRGLRHPSYNMHKDASGAVHLGPL
jgi:hypothetical protein